MVHYALIIFAVLHSPFVAADAPCAQFQNLSEPTVEAFQKGNVQFAKHLFRLARENNTNQNIFFSPASIAMALAMLLEGARGSTREEIKNILVKDLNDTEISKSYFNLMSSLYGENTNYELFSANKFYAQSNYKLNKEYVETLTQCYNSDAKLVDFGNKSTEIRNEVNKFVEEKTEEKIKDLLPKGSVSEDTKLILVNAIYFKGQWETPFTNNFEGLFYPTGNSEGQKVQYTSHTGTYRHLIDNLRMKMIELPYKGAELSMYILLPSKDVELGIEEVEVIPRIFDQNSNLKEVEVTIPKFELTQDLALKELLIKMGLGEMFEENHADLSGVNGQKDLFVSDAFHKAYIQVNENGTEAAAASAVVEGNWVMEVQPLPYFRADHPFFFFIKHKETNSFLFSGYLASLDQK